MEEIGKKMRCLPRFWTTTKYVLKTPSKTSWKEQLAHSNRGHCCMVAERPRILKAETKSLILVKARLVRKSKNVLFRSMPSMHEQNANSVQGIFSALVRRWKVKLRLERGEWGQIARIFQHRKNTALNRTWWKYQNPWHSAVNWHSG